MNKKLLILVIGIIAIVVIISLVAGGNKNKDTGDKPTDKTADNTTVISGGKISETKNSEGLDFSNIQLKIDNNYTIITADVRNNTSKTIESQYIDFHILDKDGKEMRTVSASVISLQPGETSALSTRIKTNEQDREAYDITVTVQSN